MKLTIEPGFDVTMERNPYENGMIFIQFPNYDTSDRAKERRVMMGLRTLIAEFYDAEDRAKHIERDYASDTIPSDDSPEARHVDEILLQINATNNVKP